MKQDTTLPDGTRTRDVLDHSWQWFELHAKQRMDLMNYFIVSVAFLAAGYAGGIQAKEPILSLGVGVLGIIISVCFQRIEERTRELIKIGEDAMAEAELMMAAETGSHRIALVQLASAKSKRFYSYRIIFRTLHIATLCFFISCVFFALYKM